MCLAVHMCFNAYIGTYTVHSHNYTCQLFCIDFTYIEGIFWGAIIMTCTISTQPARNVIAHVTALPLVDGGGVDWASILPLSRRPPQSPVRSPPSRRHLLRVPPHLATRNLARPSTRALTMNPDLT
jgi:hypothetical protein